MRRKLVSGRSLFCCLVLALPFLSEPALAGADDTVSYGYGLGTAYYSAPPGTYITGIGGGYYPSFPNVAVLIYQPGVGGLLSDAVWMDNGYLDFESALVDGTLPDLPGGITIVNTLVANGLFQDVGSLLIGSPFQGLPDYVDVQTAITPVPEATTWSMMLLGFGLIGAGLRVAHRKRSMTLAAAQTNW